MSLRTYNHLSPARQPGESHDNYRARRKVINRAVKLALRGVLTYEATRPTVALPLAGVDPAADEHILAGRITDVVLVTVKDKEGAGKQFRIGRSKGVSRVHPSKKLNPGMKRAERRALYRGNEWRAAA